MRRYRQPPRIDAGIGDFVWTKVEGQPTRIGFITGESHGGDCWIVRTTRDETSFHKSQCKRIGASKASSSLRELRQRVTGKGKAQVIYGDGDL